MCLTQKKCLLYCLLLSYTDYNEKKRSLASIETEASYLLSETTVIVICFSASDNMQLLHELP